MRDDSDAGRVAQAKSRAESGYAGLDPVHSKPSDEANKIARKILEFTVAQCNGLANRDDLEGDDLAVIREALLNAVDEFGSLATEMWQGE
jgi:hypothetical protein